MGDSKDTHQYLRYDPERTDFTVTEAELEILERGNAPLWKDVLLFSFPLAASTLFNAYGEAKAQTTETVTFTLPIFINSIIGVVSIGFALLASVAWFKTKSTFRAVVERIKKKPRYPVPPGTFPTKQDTEQEADPQRRPRKKKDKKGPSAIPPESTKNNDDSSGKERQEGDKQ